MAPGAFWESTAWEVMEWGAECAIGHGRRATELAWLSGYYHRVKEMPPLGDEIAKIRRKGMTKVEQKSVVDKSLHIYSQLGLVIPDDLVIE